MTSLCMMWAFGPVLSQKTWHHINWPAGKQYPLNFSKEPLYQKKSWQTAFNDVRTLFLYHCLLLQLDSDRYEGVKVLLGKKILSFWRPFCTCSDEGLDDLNVRACFPLTWQPWENKGFLIYYPQTSKRLVAPEEQHFIHPGSTHCLL